MDKIQEYLKNPLITAGIGFLIGLIIGLPILGWGLMPVKWTDADPSYLRADLQDDYFCMTIHSFMRTGNSLQAKDRLEGLGPVSEEKLNNLLPGDCGLSDTDIAQFKTALGVAAMEQPVEVSPSEGEENPVVDEPSEEAAVDEERTSGFNLFVLVGALCGVTLLIGAALVYIFFLRKKNGTTTPERVRPLTEKWNDYSRACKAANLNRPGRFSG